MPVVTISIYMTPVTRGTVTANSTLVRIAIDDQDGDGAISRDEWQAFTGNQRGQIAGDTTPPGLWNGSTGALGNNSTGTLYTPTPFSRGADVGSLLNAYSKSGFRPTIASLNVCFLAGTMIATPGGEVAVESLRPGDLVLTRDHGPQPLVWTHATHVTPADLDLAPNKRPIRIRAGALGRGLPRRDTDVSPQHRVLVADAEGGEYLISARHLMKSGAPGIGLRPGAGAFDLVHIAFAAHQVVIAEGAPMESFYTGRMAVRALSVAQRLGLIACFPAIATGENPMTPARPFIGHRDLARIRAAPAAAG
ncbi:Hint domain-containing protein [Paracoccus spongiarum]|uniref:Hint domain-containing protein n=1 Tax=Paracoccus spongiarum TaxID=3064387 RepID=A0ABT9JAS4_9RHOB|nr:Hint domain-containing protein [Paracoccus sp. 2205BS29-5]MDP5306908.1 Hint domain-containing protein [Paracoccus sp. 2205BS29-5]